jgi:Uma2 family endonuclease
MDMAPDLAVEVVSPGDTAWEVREKVEDWLKAGTRLVWTISSRPLGHSLSVFKRLPGVIGGGQPGRQSSCPGLYLPHPGLVLLGPL